MNVMNKVARFQQREIRRTMHDGEWWLVITDVIAALTDSADPSEYWKKMRKRDPDLSTALQGGDNLSPPCLRVRHGRGAAETPVLEHRGRLPPDPIHPQPPGRAVQTLAGPSRQGTD